MAATMSQSAFAEANGLTILRRFAQSRANTLGPLPYDRAPTQQPMGYLAWPWIKKEKLLREYLRFNRETPFFSDLKVDYSPLLWCERARDEALKFFCEENYLIRVTVYGKEDTQNPAQGALLLPCDELRVPIELFDTRMLATLEAGVTIRLQIGEGCGTAPTTMSNNIVYDKIFGYNKHSWADYCQTLASNGFRRYSGLIINLHQRYRTNFRELVPDFLLELAHVRSAGNVWLTEMVGVKFFDTLAFAMSATPVWPWNWHDLLIGLYDESEYRSQNDSINAAFVTLSRANTCAEQALSFLSIFMKTYKADLYRPYINGTYALCTKIFITYVWIIHLMLDTQYKNGVRPTSAIIPIKKMGKAMYKARTWPGMKPEQLAGSLFASGVFYSHVASYLCTPANMEAARNDPDFNAGFDVDDHRQRAGHCLYAAAKIFPSKYERIGMTTWENHYKMHGNGKSRELFIPKLETLSTQAGGEWYGIASMWQRWGIHNLHELEKLQEVVLVTQSKSQIKKCREQLGVTNCRKEGLLRCMLA